jgi:hypothetical protein
VDDVCERVWPSADVVISTAEAEVLIGDRLAENLGVVNSAWVEEPTWLALRKAARLSAGFYKAKACPWGGKWDGDL